MNKQRRTFHTFGPVDPEENYFVSRKEELEKFLDRIERGRYAVIFAPRQTGKTTFFKQAINMLEQKPSYIPIQLDFQVYVDASRKSFIKTFTAISLMQ